MKFLSIEGFRAWLAWIVFFHHLILFTGCSYLFTPVAKVLSKAGDYSVLVFIVISGFVITNLLLVKNEPYRLYIVRRFLRLYPVYIVALVLGILGTYLEFKTFLYSDLNLPVGLERLNNQYQSYTNFFFDHLIAHLTMLHGVISNNILYESQYMFLSPAWSLSLEWQFYLIAPFVVACIIKSNKTRILLAGITAISYFLFQRGLLGSFILPSLIAGVYFLFAFGIFCRFYLDLINNKFYEGLFFIILVSPLIPINVLLPCVIFYIFIYLSNSKAEIVENVFSKLFLSKFFLNQGSRSYCVYLIHVPIIQILAFLFIKILGLSQSQAFVLTGIFGFLITFTLSGLISKYIEQPMISYGKSLKL